MCDCVWLWVCIGVFGFESYCCKLRTCTFMSWSPQLPLELGFSHGQWSAGVLSRHAQLLPMPPLCGSSLCSREPNTWILLPNLFPDSSHLISPLTPPERLLALGYRLLDIRTFLWGWHQGCPLPARVSFLGGDAKENLWNHLGLGMSYSLAPIFPSSLPRGLCHSAQQGWKGPHCIAPRFLSP